MKPFGGPYTVDAPSHTLENQLPEQIPVSRCPGTVVADTIALDPEKIPPLVPGIADRQVDAITTGPDLHVYCQTPVHQGSSHGLLELIRLRVRPDRCLSRKFAISFRKFKEVAERDGAPVVRVHARKVLRTKACDQDAFPL